MRSRPDQRTLPTLDRLRNGSRGNAYTLDGVKSSQVVGLRDRVAIIRTLIFSSPHPYAGSVGEHISAVQMMIEPCWGTSFID